MKKLPGEIMKNIMLIFVGLFVFVPEVRAEVISVPCDEFNKTTGEHTNCEWITSGYIKIDRTEYEKYQSIYKARLSSGVNNPPPSIPKWEANDSDSNNDKGSDDCNMPPWVRKPSLKCD